MTEMPVAGEQPVKAGKGKEPPEKKAWTADPPPSFLLLGSVQRLPCLQSLQRKLPTVAAKSVLPAPKSWLCKWQVQVGLSNPPLPREAGPYCPALFVRVTLACVLPTPNSIIKINSAFSHPCHSHSSLDASRIVASFRDYPANM